MRLVSASDLKRQRGWTETLLTELLAAPDALGANPHGYRPPQRFFMLDRVVEAERDPSFTRRAAQLGERARWRRELPSRTWSPDEVARLEWLDDPWRMRLFLTPRRPRVRRTRRPKPEIATSDRFEAMRLFDVAPYAASVRG